MESVQPRAWVIRGGLVFDGCGNPGGLADLLVEHGKVTAWLAPGATGPADAATLDARGCWVVPGFIDMHTHYDAELELFPALGESVRHGVTTVFLGSCGLSLALGEATALADMFCRVEGVPRSIVLPLLTAIKNWDSPAAYLDHLQSLPLGPNVSTLLGHSAIRAASMGLERSLDPHVRPSSGELAQMVAWLKEALDAGYLGLSINTLPWDKMDGEQFRSRPTPSVFAGWAEYRHLAAVLRARGRVFQGVPNVSTKVNVLLFALASMGWTRPALKTTLIAMMDPPAARGIHRIIGALARVTNRWLGGDLRFQALPNPFDMWVDGIEVPVFEEFAAGTEALHHTDPSDRAALLRDPDYRRRFRRQWADRLRGRAYHRDLARTEVLACPDPSLVGQSFAEIAAARSGDPVDVLLDLVADHGLALRWRTIVANDRPEQLAWIVDHPDAMIGFSDAGAHLRNMAYYNFPLRMLRMVQQAALRGQPIMTIERAVYRLTGEIAQWFGIAAGTLTPGARADVAVIDPAGLDDQLETLHEQEFSAGQAAEATPAQQFAALRRLVRRNDAAVRHVLIGGRTAWHDGQLASELGQTHGFGQVLRAQG